MQFQFFIYYFGIPTQKIIETAITNDEEGELLGINLKSEA